MFYQSERHNLISVRDAAKKVPPLVVRRLRGGLSGRITGGETFFAASLNRREFYYDGVLSICVYNVYYLIRFVQAEYT